MEGLHLLRPLAVFDIEATGINRKVDRIIDLSVITLHPDGNRTEDYFRCYPEMPIPPESTEIHHITDEDVKDAPTFKEVVNEVEQVFEGCDLGGFNILHFDIPMLQEEFQRCGKTFRMDDRFVFDAQRVFHRKEPRDLSAALAFYAGESHEGAHNAVDDVKATIRVMEGQYQKYKDLPSSLGELDEFCNPRDPEWADRSGRLKWRGDTVVVNFGKMQGRSLDMLAKSETGYLTWIVKNDFPQDTKDIVRHFMNGGTSAELKKSH